MIVAKIVVRLGKVIGILYATDYRVSRGSRGQNAESRRQILGESGLGGAWAWGVRVWSGRSRVVQVSEVRFEGGSNVVRVSLGGVRVLGSAGLGA